MQRSGAFARRHSQIRMTFGPNWRSRRLFRRSRAWVRVILSCHAFWFVFDVRFLQLCPCQIQPSTKTSVFSFEKTKSGRPGSDWFRLHPVKRHSRNRRTRRFSVVALPLLRIASHQFPANQTTKRRTFLPSVAGSSTHGRISPWSSGFLRIAERTFVAASNAYRGGTALPIRSHTVSILSVANL